MKNVTDNETGSVIWRGCYWDDRKIETDEQFAKEVRYGRIVNAEGKEAITAKYIKKYTGDLTGSIVYLGECHSAHDTILAQAFIDKGAVAVIGNSRETQQLYNNIIEYTVTVLMCQTNPNSGQQYTFREALEEAKFKYGMTDKDLYPEMHGARPYVIGDGSFVLDKTAGYDVVTIMPYYDEAAGKGGDSKIELPEGVNDQAELIEKAAQYLVDNAGCTYSFRSRNEILDENILSHLHSNQIILM